MKVSDFPECKRALWRAIDEARTIAETGSTEAAHRHLHSPGFRLAEVVARRRCRELSTNADTDHIQSVVTQAVWEAIGRTDLSMDTRQVFQYLLQRANHAVSDAARAADPLPRRARAYRKGLLLAADRLGLHGDDAEMRRLARDMFPAMTFETFELVVRGAPPAIEVDRAEAVGAVVAPRADPAEAVVDRHRADAVHVAMSDQPDPAFRAWAASVLSGEVDGRRLPKVLRPGAPRARQALGAWA